MQALLITTFSLCLAVSFLLSGMEAGVFALSRLRIRHLMRTGNRRAKALHAYLENPEDFLWTLLVGNIVANVVVFSLIVIGLYRWLAPRPALLLAALLVAGALFYALCELLPKMLFRVYPNRLCLWLSLPFGLVHTALRPLVAPLAWLANRLLGWFGGKNYTARLFGNREELRLVMQEKAQDMSTEERAMINRVLDLQNLSVRQITVPLAKVACVTADTPVDALLALCRERGVSRVPVVQWEGSRRRITGLVALNSVLLQTDLNPKRPAGEFLKPALFFDADLRLEVALRQMQRTGQRLAVVLERDRTELGIVSLQDILRVIFGEVHL